MDEIKYQTEKFLNADYNLFNSKNYFETSTIIKNQLSEQNNLYNSVGLNFFTEILEEIHKSVDIREKIIVEITKNPTMIKNSDSAIVKTICSNLSISNEELKADFLEQIKKLKKVYELHSNGEDIAGIFRQTRIFESELKKFLNIY